MCTFVHGHALIIGVGADLPNTLDDAQGIRDILTDPSRCAYSSSQVKLVVGKAADRESVLVALDELAKRASSDSIAIVYFSGHGYRISSQRGVNHYLLTNGYDMSNLGQTAIHGREFTQKLLAIKSQKLLLLLDCCHAGGLDDVKAPGQEFTRQSLPPEAMELLVQGGGRVAIASCKEKELSFAGKPYSAFTLALLEAFCGDGASREDGYVRVTDLALHTRQMVTRRTGDRQHPTMELDQADNFVVAYYAGGDSQPKGLPFPVEEIEIEVEPGAFRATFAQQYQSVQGDQTNVEGGLHRTEAGGDIADRGGAIHRGGGVSISGTGIDIGGDVVGGSKTEITDSTVTIVGRDLFQGQIADHSALIAELRKLRQVFDQVVEQEVIDEESAILASAQVDAAIKNVEKSQPDGDTIVKRLEMAREIIEKAATGAGAAAGIITAITRAVGMIHQFFA